MTPAIDVRLVSADRSRAAAAIAALANSNVTEDVFVRDVLENAVGGLGACAAAFWRITPQGVLSLAGEKGLADTGVTRDPALSRLNITRLIEVARNAQPVIHDDGPILPPARG